MAVSFLNLEVSDLCLGKPALRSLPITSTVADALSALKRSGNSHVSVWSCNHGSAKRIEFESDCRCVGKLCMVDVICFLCREDNLKRPLEALQSPVSDLLPKSSGIVRHLERNSSLLEAIDYILEGAQNLIVPIHSYKNTINSRKNILKKQSSFGSTLHNGHEFCWLNQEDVIRFLLNSIGSFSPIPAFSIESLNLIDKKNILTVFYNCPAASVLPAIARAHADQTSVAVVDEDNVLVGEISPCTLACCDETVAAAIATLSACDLMAYIDCGGPPEDLVQLVKTRLGGRNLMALLEFVEECSLSSSSCSSDEEFVGFGSGRYSPARRRSEAIVCFPWSSVVAVMIQALAHRVSYVWVVEEDHSLAGIVTFAGILEVFRSVAGGSRKSEGVNTFKQ